MDVESNLWKKLDIDETHESPGPRDSHSMAVVGQNIIIFGGTDGRQKFNDIHVLSLESARWSLTKQESEIAPCPRESHTFTKISEFKFLVFGGSGPGSVNYLNDVHLLTFDETLDVCNWQKQIVGGKLPPGRDSHSAVFVDGQVVVFGGDSGEKYLGAVEILNLETWTWSTLEINGVQPGARAGHTCFVLNGKVFIHGGVGNHCYFSDLWMLDLDTATWVLIETAGEPTQPRFSHTLTVLHNTAIVFGGCGENENPIPGVSILEFSGSSVPPAVSLPLEGSSVMSKGAECGRVEMGLADLGDNNNQDYSAVKEFANGEEENFQNEEMLASWASQTDDFSFGEEFSAAMAEKPYPEASENALLARNHSGFAADQSEAANLPMKQRGRIRRMDPMEYLDKLLAESSEQSHRENEKSVVRKKRGRPRKLDSIEVTGNASEYSNSFSSPRKSPNMSPERNKAAVRGLSQETARPSQKLADFIKEQQMNIEQRSKSSELKFQAMRTASGQQAVKEIYPGRVSLLVRPSSQSSSLIGCAVSGTVDGTFETGLTLSALVKGQQFRGILFPVADSSPRSSSLLDSKVISSPTGAMQRAGAQRSDQHFLPNPANSVPLPGIPILTPSSVPGSNGLRKVSNLSQGSKFGMTRRYSSMPSSLNTAREVSRLVGDLKAAQRSSVVALRSPKDLGEKNRSFGNLAQSMDAANEQGRERGSWVWQSSNQPQNAGLESFANLDSLSEFEPGEGFDPFPPQPFPRDDEETVLTDGLGNFYRRTENGFVEFP